MILFFSQTDSLSPIAGRFFGCVCVVGLCLAGVAWTADAAANPDRRDDDSTPSMFDDRTLAMQTAVDRALERKSFEQLIRARRRRADASVTHARRFPNPSLSYTHEQAFRDTTSAENTFLLQQLLPLAGRTARIDAARKARSAEKLDAQADRRELAAATRRLWVRWAAACRRHRVRSEYARRLEKGLQVVDKRVEAGEAPKLDRSRFRRELASTRADIADARSECRARWSALAARMDGTGAGEGGGRASETMPRPERNPWPAPDSKLDLESALERLPAQPALEAHQKKAESSDRLAESVRQSRWPDPSIRGGVRSFHSPDGVDPGLVAGVSVPLPFWHEARGRVDELEAEAGVARSRYREALRHRRGELTAAWHRARGLSSAAERLERDGLPAARRAARRARSGYDGGEIRLSTYLDTVRALEQTRLRLIQLQTDARRHWIRVHRIVGGAPPPNDDASTGGSSTSGSL